MNRTRVAVAMLVTLLICTLAVTPAVAEPTPAPPDAKGKAAAAAVATPVDNSATLPRTVRDEVTGDFLGLGYDQRMRAEGGSLNIYNPPALGGNRLRSTPLDLSPPSGAEYWYRDQPGTISLWAQASNKGTADCFGCFAAIDEVYHLASVYLAVIGGSLYISGTKGDAINGGSNDKFPPASSNGVYRNLLYRVPADGSCAAEGCAWNVAELPTLLDYSFPDPARAVGVTALAAGLSGGNGFVAVGMSDYGVRVFKGDLSSYSDYGGMATANDSQTPVSALAFDPSGSGVLAVGVVSVGVECLTLTVNPDGSTTGTQGSLVLLGQAGLDPFPLSVTFGRRANATNVVAWGLNNGGVLLHDPKALGAQALAGGSGSAGISVINAVPRIDGSGYDDYAIAMQTTGDVAGPMIGQLMSWTAGTGTLALQQVTVDTAGNSSNTLLDRTSFLNWFPGYKQGRFQVHNDSSESVTVLLKARPEAAYGCWWAGTWADGAGPAGPFPSDTSGLTLDPGETSDRYVMGAYTGGAKGLCGATDVTGDWRGYLVVTPVGRPADTKLVNVQLGRNWAVDISTDQTAGSTTVTGSRTGPGGAFGTWLLTVDTPAPATMVPPAAAPPVVTASVVTTTKRPRGTVYRFDVSAVKWTAPGATTPSPGATTDNSSAQVLIPPLQVQGTIDGFTWLPLGSFMPVGNLSRKGQVITVGDPNATVGGAGTFFWENPPPPTPGTNSPLLPVWAQIRVLAAGAQVSAPVVLSSLTPPSSPSTPITAVTLSAGSDATSGAAVTPAPNGVDQSRLQVSLTAGGGTLSSNDPAYTSVYYRTDGDTLVTNLYDPTAYDEFVGVQPLAGAGTALTKAAKRGSGSVPVPAYDYLSTTSTTPRYVKAYVGWSISAAGSQSISVNSVALDIEPAGTAADGFSLEGCADFKDSTTGTCNITPVADGLPALYQAGSEAAGPIIGAQLSYPARNSVADLPMEWQAKNGAEKLTKASLTESNVKAQLPDNTAFLPADNVDVNLVSHGQPVPAAGDVPATVNVGTG